MTEEVQRKKACIICLKEVESGTPVEDEPLIIAIRKVKQRFNIAKNNELVVCQNDMEEYLKKRKKYETNIAIYSVIAAIVVGAFIFLPLFLGTFSLPSIITSIGFALFIIILPIISSYTPALSKKPQAEEKAEAAAQQAEAEKEQESAPQSQAPAVAVAQEEEKKEETKAKKEGKKKRRKKKR